MNKSDALRDKVIAVTGGARGIGFETATQLFDAKAKVVIGDIDGDAVGKAAADLGIDGIELDVTKPESIEAFLDETEKRVGPIDVLVNNAGIMPVGPFLDYDAALIRRTIDIDLMGVIYGSQAAARRMVPRGHGHIVNVASVAGRLPMPGLTVYNAAKAGVIEFSDALHAELADAGVSVSAILPSFTNTGLISGLETNRYIRVVEPEVVAETIVDTIVKPQVRVAAPRSMGWVNSNTIMPQSLKRRSRKMTGLDHIFLQYDDSSRAEYNKRIGQ
ncbi:MAG: SDR family oxidoreductase [Gordonia sp. (in: high G+C Gram-positive bacteria)]|uniref:SDR family oxidoreductase n=1 Tax=Gordonia sp. (in: high G+C Gram-positive bacteria) TaxID=84139 RepID=UPI0039E5CA96